MSPEQVEGDKDLDARADVYALGVILYECAAGRRPYEAEALPRLAVMIHEGKPTPLAELRPDLPPAFVEVVAHAMANDRDQRFASAAELGDALVHFGTSALDVTLEEPAPGALARRSSKRPVVARISDPLPPSKQSSAPPTVQPPAGKASPKPISPSTAGAAISVARERRPPLWGLAVAAVLVAAAGGSFFAFRSHEAARSAVPASSAILGAAPPPAAPPTRANAAVESVESRAAASPAPSAVASILPPAPISPHATGAPAAGASRGVPASSASVVGTKPSVATTPIGTDNVPAKPAASTRVDQRGLVGDNPFR
jgi:serine/threonine-protein kinase